MENTKAWQCPQVKELKLLWQNCDCRLLENHQRTSINDRLLKLCTFLLTLKPWPYLA
jgi:hypothetical protein